MHVCPPPPFFVSVLPLGFLLLISENVSESPTLTLILCVNTRYTWSGVKRNTTVKRTLLVASGAVHMAGHADERRVE